MKAKLKVKIPKSIIDKCLSNGVPKKEIRKTFKHILWLEARKRFSPDLEARKRFSPDSEEAIIEEIMNAHRFFTSGPGKPDEECH